MKEFNISSDLSITNTKITMDGKDLTKKGNVVGISMYASSPSKDDSDYAGYVDLSITTVDDNGTVEEKSYRKSEYMSKKLPMGKVLKDFITTKDDVVRYIGSDVNTDIKKLADSIIEHCKEKELKCPDQDVLYNRTVQSLTDKATDLGLITDSEEDPATDDPKPDEKTE